jgi:hypothetical protein
VRRAGKRGRYVAATLQPKIRCPMRKVLKDVSPSVRSQSGHRKGSSDSNQNSTGDEEAAQLRYQSPK